jgi:hypothetical protein
MTLREIVNKSFHNKSINHEFLHMRLTPFVQSLHAWLPLNPHLETLYWHSRPWLITLGNLNGTLATWMFVFLLFGNKICILNFFLFSPL